jgi:hypothetical protein
MSHALDDLAVTDKDALQASKHYHAWDGRNVVDIEPYISHLDDKSQRNLITSIITSFKKEIIESGEGEKFRMGINHADFNDANIIVGNEDGDGIKVTGVIDFGDTVYSWKVLDVAVAMTYALISSYGKSGRSISAACAFLRGFHHVYPLTAQERKHLRLLIACRLATSATFGNYTYKLNPENKYILLHSKPAWEALDYIWGCDGRGAGGTAAALIESAFEVACSGTTVPDGSSIPSCVDLSFPDPTMPDPFSVSRVEAGKGAPVDSQTITFVTGNKKKTEEVKRILASGSSDFPYKITNHKVDLP